MSARRAECSEYDQGTDEEMISEAISFLMGVLAPEDFERLARQACSAKQRRKDGAE